MTTTTETPTISLTGVLRRPCCPDHLPHDDRATESEALDRIIAHMQIDALEPGLMDRETGPLFLHERHCVYAHGNFTICSGRFRIYPLSRTGHSRLMEAWLIHEKSEQYRLSQKLDVLHDACNSEINAVSRTVPHYEAEQKRRLIRTRYRLKSQPLEIRLQAIYERRT